MAKTSGLGDALYFGGYDLSGDVQSLGKISSPIATLDVTSIAESAFERLTGHRDGLLQMVTYWNPGPAANAAHLVLSVLPTADVTLTYCRGTVLGNPAACMVSKQINYDGTRANTGAYTFAVNAQANGFGLEWGNLLTAGIRTDTAATNGTAFDGANGLTTPAVPATTVPVTNPSPMPVTVVISGGTMSNVSINGATVGTGAGTYTLPQGATIVLTYSAAPTWTWTATTAFGAQAYLQMTGFTGTDVTVKLQDSADGTTFADVASGAFTQVTSSTPGTQRLALSNSATLRRYVRASTITTGGFTSASFAVVLVRNLVAGQVF